MSSGGTPNTNVKSSVSNSFSEDIIALIFVKCFQESMSSGVVNHIKQFSFFTLIYYLLNAIRNTFKILFKLYD